MRRRQGKGREEDAPSAPATGAARPRAHRKRDAQRGAAPTIEIEVSDADYRTLHMPCDALEEGAGSEPGH
ncbi:MAG: hypothetical protein KDI17_07035 [Halioglobus sp.]|nr:hypothetical protein [Halioglobus sp.]